jgi:hypothetical protein
LTTEVFPDIAVLPTLLTIWTDVFPPENFYSPVGNALDTETHTVYAIRPIFLSFFVGKNPPKKATSSSIPATPGLRSNTQALLQDEH